MFFIGSKENMAEIYISWISKHLFDVPRGTSSIYIWSCRPQVYLSDLSIDDAMLENSFIELSYDDVHMGKLIVVHLIIVMSIAEIAKSSTFKWKIRVGCITFF